MADDERPAGGAQQPPEFPGEEEGFSDPITGPPKFRSGNVSRRYGAGQSVVIRLPQDAAFDGAGLSYEWHREPAWTGSGLVYNANNHTITGTARIKDGECTTLLRGTWRAVGEVEDAQFEGNVNYDQISVRIEIRPARPLALPARSELTLTAGEPLPRTTLPSATGGKAPYVYELVPLPGAETANLNTLGITFDARRNRISAARIRGVYRRYKFQHRVYDECRATAVRFGLQPVGQTLYITVRAPSTRPLILNNGNDIVLGGRVGERFDATLPFGAINGVSPLTWTFSMPRLPPGAMQVSRSGDGGRKVRIHGTPSTAGTYRGTWSVEDSSTPARTATVNVVITINPALALTLNGGNDVTQRGPQGRPFNLRLTGNASGGTAPYAYSLSQVNLPAGLSHTRSGSVITISGTPSASGTYVSTWTVTDSSSPSRTASVRVRITVTPPAGEPLTLNSGADVRATGRVGSPLNVRLPATAAGGTAPYDYDLADVTLPPGNVQYSRGGTRGDNSRIHGTPNAAGVYESTWRVRDGSTPRQSADVGVRITVLSATALTLNGGNDVTQSGPAGRPFNLRLTGNASGGTAPYTYVLSNASLPDGMSHARRGTRGDDIRIFGTPTEVGRFRSVWQVSDARARSARVNVDITITPSTDGVTLNNGNAVALEAEVGRYANLPLPATTTGGVGGKTYTLTFTPPAGMRVRRLGVGGRNTRIQGTPRTAGVYRGTWTVADSATPRQTASVAVVLTVSAGRSLAPQTWTAVPGRPVSESLPTLSGAKGSVAYSIIGAANLASMNLEADAAALTLTGTVPDPPPRTVATFWQTARDSDGASFTAKHTVNVRARPLAAVSQSDISVREGNDPRRAIRPFTGGIGEISYRLSGAAGSGLSASKASGVWEIRGTAAQVGAAGRTWNATLTGADSTGAEASTGVRIRVTDTLPPAAFQLADETVLLANASTGTRTLAAATEAGAPAANVTYTATRDSGEPASVASVSGRTLTYDTGDSPRRRQAVWLRSATAPGGKSASATLQVVIYGRMAFPDPGGIGVRLGVPVPAGRQTVLRASGGSGSYAYALASNLPPASGLSVAVSGSGATGLAVVSGTPLAVGVYTASLTATDGIGSSANATLTVVVDSAVNPRFRFESDRYTYRAKVGETVEWDLPEPVDATGGVQALAVNPQLPAGLVFPAGAGSDGVWTVTGTVNAPPGETEHALTATDGAGDQASTRLIVVVGDEDPEVLHGGCGPIELVREPRGQYPPAAVLGSVLPLPGDLGPIRNFRPSAFAAAPGASVVFDWEVAGAYRGVPILEVDLWRTDADDPFCAGIPNIRPTLSVEHEISSGYETTLPEAPGVYLYRLVALRGGSGGRYLSADWWDCTILVTEEANAVHLSASKTAVPELFPVVLQWGFKGAQPTGDVAIAAGPRRVSPTEAIGPTSAAPAADQGSDAGPVAPQPGQGGGIGLNELPGEDDVVDGTRAG